MEVKNESVGVERVPIYNIKRYVSPNVRYKFNGSRHAVVIKHISSLWFHSECYEVQCVVFKQ